MRRSYSVGLQLLLGWLGHWLERKVPKSLLILAVVTFSFLGLQGSILLYQVKNYFWPTIHAVANRSPDAPLAVFCWAVVALFYATCLIHKRVAFLAALQLQKRFNTTLAP